jgi:hypothetical protein
MLRFIVLACLSYLLSLALPGLAGNTVPTLKVLGLGNQVANGIVGGLTPTTPTWKPVDVLTSTPAPTPTPTLDTGRKASSGPRSPLLPPRGTDVFSSNVLSTKYSANHSNLHLLGFSFTG